jgi:hypothetical protein
MRVRFWIFVLLLWSATAAAQEISFLGGAMKSDNPDAHSYAWMLSYTHDLNENFAASFTWLNEGHVPNHHRDGHSVQLWARSTFLDPRFTLGVGAGPYRYFDTTVANNGGSYSDAHGWGGMYSLAARWQTSGSMYYEARINRVGGGKDIDSTEFLVGLGWKLDQDGAAIYDEARGGGAAKRNELTLFLGQTIVNSFESEHSVASSLEYRRAFTPVIRGSVAWINEGDARLIRRNGVTAQGWLEPSFSGDRFSLGVGAGAYIAVDQYRQGDHGAFASGIITMTTAYHWRDWTARFSWHRIVSNYDRDSDIMLLGVGRRF